MWTLTIRHCASVALILGCLSSQASADCQADVPGARLIGSGEFCVLGFCLYDAQLWATHAPAKFDEPFALLLTYRHSVQGDRMVDIGIAEIERMSPRPLPAVKLSEWRADMARAFHDVAPGDRLCGVFLPRVSARFYSNGSLVSEVADPEFATAFFRIWLDPDTRAGQLRRKLLGETQ